MKILSVSFENIHSLKGKWEINFETPPLSEAAVFAIVGNTGAGKTSILDAIAVSLYGKVPRHDGKDSTEIMTRQTISCFAQTTFEVGNKRYSSRWEARRTKKTDGQMQPTKMSFYELDGNNETITNIEGVKNVSQKVEEITGLGYKQFTRSVILPQGDFAAFLKSDKNERGALLEQITGNHIFRTISIAVYDRAKEEKQKLEQLKEATKHIMLLTDEQIKEILQIKNEHTDLRNKEQQQYDQATARLHNLKNMVELEAKQQDDIVASNKLNETYQHIANDKLKLAAHDKAETLRNDIKNVDDYSERSGELSKQIKIEETELKDIIPQRETAQQNHKETELAWQQIQKEHQLAMPNIEKAIGIQHKIDAEKRQIYNNKQKLNDLALRETKVIDDQNEQNKKLQDNENSLETTTQWLQANQVREQLNADLPLLDNYLKQQIDANTKETDLKQKIDKTQENINEFEQKQKEITEKYEQAKQNLLTKQTELDSAQAAAAQVATRNDVEQERLNLSKTIPLSQQLQDIAIDYNAKQQTIDQLKEQHKQQSQDLENLEKDLIHSQSILENEQKILHLLDKARLQERTIANFEQARQNLTHDEPCPLCGSVHHPYIQGNYQTNVSKTEKDYETQNEKVIQLNKTHNDQKNKETSIIKEIAERRAQAKIIQEEMKKAQEKFDQQSTQNSNLPQIGITQPELWQAYTQQLQEKETELKALFEQTKAHEQEIERAKTAKLAAEKESNKLQNELETNLLKLNNAQKELVKYQNDYEQISISIAAQETQIINIIQKYADLGKVISAAHLKNMPEIIKRLQQKKVEFDEQTSKKQEAQQNILLAQAELENIKIQLQRIAEDITDENKSLQTNEAELILLNEQFAILTASMTCPNPNDERKRLDKAKENKQTAYQEAKSMHEKITNAITTLRGNIEKNKAKFEKNENDYNFSLNEVLNKAKQLGFGSILAAKNALLDPEEANKLRRQINNIEQEKALLHKKIEDRKQEIESIKQKIDPNDTQNSLENQIAISKQQMSDADQKIGEIQAQLSNNETQKQKIGEQQSQIEQQQKQYDKWEALNKLIGSAKGDTFSQYAQGLVLDQLVKLANKHLLILDDRYQIRQITSQANELSLELEIIDNYQAQMPRKMNSLSGGETFLVSLSLALGLSDLVGRKTQIKSLFIDEGFGTLDETTLHLVIATLEALQIEGRNVGIISHVKDLQDSITTRIEVKKQGNGTSKLILPV